MQSTYVRSIRNESAHLHVMSVAAWCGLGKFGGDDTLIFSECGMWHKIDHSSRNKGGLMQVQ